MSIDLEKVEVKTVALPNEKKISGLLESIKLEKRIGVDKNGNYYIMIIPILEQGREPKQLGDAVFVDNRGMSLFKVYAEDVNGISVDEVIAYSEKHFPKKAK
jgi:hypothetical protein